MTDINDRIIQRVILSICLDQSKEAIHSMLQADGMSEYDIFLAYCAAKTVITLEK
jgi:hypothetical protein